MLLLGEKDIWNRPPEEMDTPPIEYGNPRNVVQLFIDTH